MQITEKQKQQLIDLNDSRVNEILELVLEDNTWYIYETKSIQFNIKNGHGYGYSNSQGWVDKCEWLRYPNCNGLAKKATKQEVEEALIKEAKRRGYKNGNYKCLSSRTIKVVDRYFFDKDNRLWHGVKGVANLVFINGQWAEIIDEKAELKQEIKELEVKLQELRDKL